MADEKIEVGYRNIGSQLGVNYYHKFLLYTDASGNQRTISGWTDDVNVTEDLPFGNIRVLADTPFDANNPDSPLRHPGQNQYRETIVEGADLSATWASMVSIAESKDNIYPYDPLSQNSNTLADSVLKDAGLRQPTQDGIFGHLAPGSDKKLDPNLVPRSADELGISNLGEALSQNNVQPGPTEFQFALAPESQQLLKDSERHVRALAEKHGIPWDPGMDNTVLAVAREAQKSGLTGITHLTAANGEIRFAQADGGPLKEGSLEAKRAANTDSVESLQQLASNDKRELNTAQSPTAPQIAEARTPEARVMSI